MFLNIDLDKYDFEICDIGMKMGIQSANENEENCGFIFSFCYFHQV